MRLAKVTTVGEDGQAIVTFYGESDPSEKNYAYLRNFMPEPGDTVVLVKQGDTYIILGTVVNGPVDVQFAKEDHNHDDAYSKTDHKHTGLENGEYGLELSSAGVLLPLKNLADSLGSADKAFSKIYGDNLYVLTKLTVGDRTISATELGTSSKPFSKGYFTTVYVGSKELTEELIKEMQNPTEWYSNSSSRKITFNGATLLPDLSNYISLGTSGKMFASGYFANLYLNGTAVSTSDKRKKKFIKNLPEKFTEFFMKLRPVTFKYKNGTSGRSHMGFIAQEVEQAMMDTGITREEFGGLVIQENGQYGLRYEEFIAIQTGIIQGLYRKVEELERKVTEFEQGN
ncbi:MAG: tail fiber domain-containing protein [Lachnospiraceae bacterium]|nr:tail fiber domain-containing protein [Lachnospiraceae bacterium]